MSKIWNIDELKNALSKNKKIKFWIIEKENTIRVEQYFLKAAQNKVELDQSRTVNFETILVKLYVYLPEKGYQGEVVKKFVRHIEVEFQIADAIRAAEQTKQQEWSLPVKAVKTIPEYKGVDPEIAENIHGVAKRLEKEVNREIAVNGGSSFNSSELFVSIHEREIILSNKTKHRYKQSRIYIESAFSGDSDEYLESQWAVSLEDLSISNIFKKASQRAKLLDQVQIPVTGLYYVLLDADVLATIFNSIISHLSGGNQYNRLPCSLPGAEFVPEVIGEKLSIRLNPELNFGADTVAISHSGFIQETKQLVEQNIVKQLILDQQYSQYLNSEPTVCRGTIEIAPGKLTTSELMRSKDVILEILQFSGLFVDANSGTFSSEIRLAKLTNNRTHKIKYIKGGSLSGSIKENFKDARFSQEICKRSHFQTGLTQGHGYNGPEYMLLSNVSVVGT